MLLRATPATGPAAATSRCGIWSLRCVRSSRGELALVGILYVLYQGGRGIAGDAFDTPRGNAHAIAALERRLGIAWEAAAQQFVDTIPGLPALLAFSYVSLHIGATTLALVWLYRSEPRIYATGRTSLGLGTAIALVIHVLYPTAPPRLAGLGIADTVAAAARIDLASGLLGPLYNPIAAVPSMHFGYALVIGVAVAARARPRLLRVAGALYPGFVLLVIVATGNHFLLDALVGAAVVAVAASLAALARPSRRVSTRLDLEVA